MSLPYVIEYLLTLERPGGGRLVNAGAGELIIPAFPPNTTITFKTVPIEGDYMYISHRCGFGRAMIPEAFFVRVSQWGNMTYEGIVGSWLLNNCLDLFVSTTRSEPAQTQIQNLTGLNQYYEGLTFFLRIQTEDDYNLVMKALARMGTSARSEQLAEEANALLRMLTGGPPAPNPPIGEG
ncbi:MAG: hypothetical protein Q7J06_05085 [Bacteroidales bacterium]|nr:hypothetical protein [Bacteroidales bacterium]